jgi:hypothetical protein
MANDLKRKRREELGDTPLGERILSNDSTSGIPSQPMPGMPQGPGNMMNNPQVPKSMGGGMPQPGRLDPKNPQSPYGDGVFSPDQYAQTGTPGFADRTEQYQFYVPGRVLNAEAYNTVAQPKDDTMLRLDGIGISQEAVSRAQKAYASSGDPTPSYQITAMGPGGTNMEEVINGSPLMAGQMSGELSGNSMNTLAMDGNTTQSMPKGDPASLFSGNSGSLGMSTGRGGGRNQLA